MYADMYIDAFYHCNRQLVRATAAGIIKATTSDETNDKSYFAITN